MGNVFISYARNDKRMALEVYGVLKKQGISLWIDVKELLPGQDWKVEIEKAIRECDIFVACLSNSSVNKRGFVQAELKKALEVAETIPEGDIFIIPVRLDDCKVPGSLSKYHWVDYFEPEEKEKLIKAIKFRLKSNEPVEAEPDQNKIIREQGVVGWNLWKSKNPAIKPNMKNADLSNLNLNGVNLNKVNLTGADLTNTDLSRATLRDADLSYAKFGSTTFGHNDLSNTRGLEEINHVSPSTVDTDTLNLSKGKLPEVFLRGCGLSDWEIESSKLFNSDLNNEEITKILYRMYDLRASQALQVSPLFISYSHVDSTFVDKLERYLIQKGIRFWRDIHDAKAGRLEAQIDRAIRQNPTVLLVLSKNSLKSDWIEHEFRTVRAIEKETGRNAFCPVALDDSWKNSSLPKRTMEEIVQYNILDFSDWENDRKFKVVFQKLIDCLELFYK